MAAETWKPSTYELSRLENVLADDGIAARERDQMVSCFKGGECEVVTGMDLSEDDGGSKQKNEQETLVDGPSLYT